MGKQHQTTVFKDVHHFLRGGLLSNTLHTCLLNTKMRRKININQLYLIQLPFWAPKWTQIGGKNDKSTQHKPRVSDTVAILGAKMDSNEG